MAYRGLQAPPGDSSGSPGARIENQLIHLMVFSEEMLKGVGGAIQKYVLTISQVIYNDS